MKNRKRLLKKGEEIHYNDQHAQPQVGKVVKVNQINEERVDYVVRQDPGDKEGINDKVVNESQVFFPESTDTVQAEQMVKFDKDKKDNTEVRQAVTFDPADKWLVASHDGNEISLHVDNFDMLVELADSVTGKKRGKTSTVEVKLADFEEVKNQLQAATETITGINTELRLSIDAHQAALGRIVELEGLLDAALTKPEPEPNLGEEKAE